MIDLLPTLDTVGKVSLFILGTLAGLLISRFFNLWTTRPRINVDTSQARAALPETGMTNAQTLSISNRRTFFGLPHEGETARGVVASIAFKDPSHNNRSYPLFWEPDALGRVNIAPGESRSICLFGWSADDSSGYYVLNQKGEKNIHITATECRAVITLRDRLGRKYKCPIKIYYDRTRVSNPPTLTIKHKIDPRVRYQWLLSAKESICHAFKKSDNR